MEQSSRGGRRLLFVRFSRCIFHFGIVFITASAQSPSTRYPAIGVHGVCVFQARTMISARSLSNEFFRAATRGAHRVSGVALSLRGNGTAHSRSRLHSHRCRDRERLFRHTAPNHCNSKPALCLPLLKPNQGFAQFINKNHFAYLMEMAFGLGIGLLIGERAQDRIAF